MRPPAVRWLDGPASFDDLGRGERFPTRVLVPLGTLLTSRPYPRRFTIRGMDAAYEPLPVHSFDPGGYVAPFREDRRTFTVAVLQRAVPDRGGRPVGAGQGAAPDLRQAPHAQRGVPPGPHPGAARLIYDWFGDKYGCLMGWYSRDIWGRAADFRAAIDLMQAAEAWSRSSRSTWSPGTRCGWRPSPPTAWGGRGSGCGWRW